MRYDNDDAAGYWARATERVRAIARSYGLPYDDVEDCAADYCSECLVRMLNGDAEPGPFNMPGPPLGRHIKWYVRAWIRDQRRSNRNNVSLEVVLAEVEAESRNDLPDTGPGPDELAIRYDLERRVIALFEQLAPRQRSILIMRLVEERRVIDIAAATGRSSAAVSKLIRRFLHRVLSSAAVYGFDPTEPYDSHQDG